MTTAVVQALHHFKCLHLIGDLKSYLHSSPFNISGDDQSKQMCTIRKVSIYLDLMFKALRLPRHSSDEESWFNDDIINAFISVLASSPGVKGLVDFERATPMTKKSGAFFATRVFPIGCHPYFSPQMLCLRIINTCKQHWVLLAFRKQNIFILDSTHSSKEVAEEIKEFLQTSKNLLNKKEVGDGKPYSFELVEQLKWAQPGEDFMRYVSFMTVPQQYEGTRCGICVCMNAVILTLQAMKDNPIVLGKFPGIATDHLMRQVVAAFPTMEGKSVGDPRATVSGFEPMITKWRAFIVGCIVSGEFDVGFACDLVKDLIHKRITSDELRVPEKSKVFSKAQEIMQRKTSTEERDLTFL